jgi:hypothetical protein
MIGLGDLMAGMGQRESQVPVIGDHQESLAVPVQTPHGKKTRLDAGKQVEEGSPPMSVTGRTENIARLVEKKVEFTLNADTPPLNFNAVDNRVHADTLLVNTPAVYRYPPLCNQPLTCAA